MRRIPLSSSVQFNEWMTVDFLVIECCISRCSSTVIIWARMSVEKNVDDLPEEILLPYEYEQVIRVFIWQSWLSLFSDYASIRVVCRQWSRLWQVTKTWRQKTLDQHLSSSTEPVSVHWQLIDPPAKFNLVPRYSHSVCHVDLTRMLYVLGGSRDLATTLNDFWRLNLATRRYREFVSIFFFDDDPF